MTREEAIEQLKWYFEYDNGLSADKETVEAYKMAIEALEQEPCDDCISREAVLDALHLEGRPTKRFDYFIAVNSDIIALPSVTPKEKTGHWVKTPKAVMGEGYMWYCDKCEHQVYQDSSRDYPSEKYCPNCGAKMVESEESEGNR